MTFDFTKHVKNTHSRKCINVYTGIEMTVCGKLCWHNFEGVILGK